jgi:predicted transcriptional regulator
MGKITTFRLDDNIIPDLKKIAIEQDRSVNRLVNKVLNDFIKNVKKDEHTKAS